MITIYQLLAIYIHVLDISMNCLKAEMNVAKNYLAKS